MLYSIPDLVRFPLIVYFRYLILVQLYLDPEPDLDIEAASWSS